MRNAKPCTPPKKKLTAKECFAGKAYLRCVFTTV